MCGIIGYVGNRPVDKVLINGLKRLEYRGYDSVGVAFLNEDFQIYKQKGKVHLLENRLKHTELKGSSIHTGIGHTRWATHGVPNDNNAHPHSSTSGRFCIVHNGIIENYNVIRSQLGNKGYPITTDTDTEILAILIEDMYVCHTKSFVEAVRMALLQVVGTYGLVVLDKECPQSMVVACNGSPVLIGIGEDEIFAASDAIAVVDYTRKINYLEDNQLAEVTKNDYRITSISELAGNKGIIDKKIIELTYKIEEIERGQYPHFMLKEIMQQPETIKNCMRGRLDHREGKIHLGGIFEHKERVLNARKIVISSCGTSWHAALIGEYIIENMLGISVEVDYASELRYRSMLLDERDLLIVISQSGETADTLSILKKAKQKGILTLGICNVVGSSIARLVDGGIYTHAGNEIGVASTKAFTNQLLALMMMAIFIGKEKKKFTSLQVRQYIEALLAIPKQVETILDTQITTIKHIARLFTYASHFLYLGRSYNFPVALEGALKLKEVSYIHAEGYPAAEMKHGPIALIDKMMPVVVIAPNPSINSKIVNNIEEVRARMGRIIAVTTDRQPEITSLSEYQIIIPDSLDWVSPILTTIPLQLLAYYIALNRGCEIDQPRNLAKSVTVE